MRRKIPSTGALIAFEAAARYQSFSRAAQELTLTEGAISRQIAVLEDYLGVQLFHRVKKRVTLSDIGTAYFIKVKEDLTRLERNTLGAMAYQNGQKFLELAVIPTFTSKWLIPKIAEFSRLHPGITINLSERALPFLFGDTNFSAAIHYRHPAWAGCAQEELFDEELVPVCSPALLGGRKVSSVVDLLSFPMLHKNTREDAWTRWFAAAGHEELAPMAGPRYDLFSMIIQGACHGIGIALVPRLYVQDELKSGTLVIPVDFSIRGLKQYCVVYPEHKEVSPAARLFLDWLVDAAAMERQPRAAPAMTKAG
ncbi:LysR substrate-binding domain-containing protein [Noviherbaspirillum suwonense]|jgi:DNA-binding transcriptional LysR family regulator|uniref:DNA-binding transcriptional regulator, LysR family n=1 Tax=Noviherbaspirillum suwonense TaxID=1224511 RepID=A0ABY1QX75_9BURK|nr:LysR substrate-binding domain-containing protein [Noviherbaspirillum suwonense]SMP80484.1 DNA-binding transcriptional regulator, LysR family [Noviherbaspirillum suwonense]